MTKGNSKNKNWKNLKIGFSFYSADLPCKFQNIKKLLRFSEVTLFRSQLASVAVGLKTLVSQVRAQRHSRIACYIIFRHRKISRKINLLRFSVASLFRSWLASLAVGWRTLVSQVCAQRHSRISCYIVFPQIEKVPVELSQVEFSIGGIYRSRFS